MIYSSEKPLKKGGGNNCHAGGIRLKTAIFVLCCFAQLTGDFTGQRIVRKTTNGNADGFIR